MKSNNDLQERITQLLNELKIEQGNSFDPDKINLSDFARRAGITRSQARTLKAHDFKVLPHGKLGKKKQVTILTGYTGILDDLLKKGIDNSQVCFDRLQDAGYNGGITTVKDYIRSHKDLLPPKRTLVAPQGNRGRRYHTDPGEVFQMDWGFVNVETNSGSSYQVACFAMICHHCGKHFIEFFPNAKQENLFIGMIHAFEYLGIPQYVLTDNMKSVVIGRDAEYRPLWNVSYAAFMKAIGFQTRLCKPRHPFTKGAVERLVRFVKDNFLAGRTFGTITDLNYEALRWCERQNNRYHKTVDCIPSQQHEAHCMAATKKVSQSRELLAYLCPVRRISFDGFVNYEGRRFGVPSSYTKAVCRIKREQFELIIYSDDLTQELVRHNVTWSRRDSYCKDQYVTEQPEEFPTDTVKVKLSESHARSINPTFRKFNFGEDIWDE